jgi:hypothetical protein
MSLLWHIKIKNRHEKRYVIAMDTTVAMDTVVVMQTPG